MRLRPSILSLVASLTVLAHAAMFLGCGGGDSSKQPGPKELVAFSFTAAHNPALPADVPATLTGSAISATVPFGTDITALVATFSTTGASVTVAGIPQVSDTTANNFATPVTYRVSATDASTQDYTVTVTVAASSAKAITAYRFVAAGNVALGASVTATISGTAIAATVPAGTVVTALVATFSNTGARVSVADATQLSSVTPNDFTAPLIYRVTAADGSTRDYTVTVTVAPAAAKEITAYAFRSADNTGLGVNVVATISGRSISATVPAGTDVTTLVAAFSTTGARVTVAGTTQVSGTTPNSFDGPVIYRVTAGNGSTQDYTVTVAVAPIDAKAITAYAFLSADNDGLGGNVVATINGRSISVTVPAGTNVRALVATFSTTGARVTVGAVPQFSGTTPNRFTSPVGYRVTAADGSTQDYTVTVTIAQAGAKEITAFAFLSANNAALGGNVIATIRGTSIAATVPAGTSLAALIATFSATGATIAVGGAAQASGVTPNDFTSPVEYRVTATDGSTRDYTVAVTVAPTTAKALTAYAFVSADNAELGGDVIATISGTSITATVPTGTRIAALVATFSTTGTNVTVGGAAQASGATANDFTHPVIYRVTAADGSTRDYTVTVTVAPATAKAITAYAFRSAENAMLGADVIATISGRSITASVPAGTSVGALVATFSTSGARVTVGGTLQASGATVNDFSTPVAYQVTAADGSTQDYAVTVIVAPAGAKEIIRYAFRSADNAALGGDVIATISGASIAATVPAGTSVASLVATFSSTGARVTVGSVAQASGATANDFTSPVLYRVTAADGSTRDYTVTVTVTPATAKAITGYAFLSADNAGPGSDVIATISGRTIAATVPSGTNLTALVATFSTTGARVTVGGTLQVSGATANDFTAPVTYRVTALDGSIQDYTVLVTVAPASAKAITAYAFRSADNGSLGGDVVAAINGRSISATVPSGTNVSALVATFSTTGTGVSVAGAPQVSGATPDDFTSPVIYRVTAADGSTQDYAVTVIVAPAGAKEITAYAFLSASNAGLVASVVATISGTSIAATVPAGSNVTALIATFSTTGASVSVTPAPRAVGGTPQASGVTANNFTRPVIYRVTAADGSTQDFTVTVTVAPTTAKAITAYAFLSANNGELARNAIATIDGATIDMRVPIGTDVTALVATFSTTGASVAVAGAPQTSGVTANDFSRPVVYRVTAADGSTQDFTVTVTQASSEKAITDFRILIVDNRPAGVFIDLIAAITGTSIVIPPHSDIQINSLVARFTTTGENVTVGGVVQVSGMTHNDFSRTLIYRVTAEDGSTQDYTVMFGHF
jgi:hypothetical protein